VALAKATPVKPTAFQKIEKGIKNAGNVLVIFGGVLFMAMMFLGTADALGRWGFNHPMYAALEISEFMMAGIVLLSWGYTQRNLGHVNVDLFTMRFPPRARAVNKFIMLLIGLVIFAVIVWQSSALVIQYSGEQRVLPYLKIPAVPFHIFVPVGAFFMCLEMIIQLAHMIPAVRGNK
jgi:TRAP-type C4-dicarboxylate transport system permease small subunit